MSWQIDRVGGAAVVTMNTNKANAQNERFFADLHEALDRLDREPPSGGIVLTEQGSIFSAGIDLKYSLPLFASGDLDAIGGWFARYRATNIRLFTYLRPLVHDIAPPDELRATAITRAQQVSPDAMAAYAGAKRGLQAPALANIAAAESLDRDLPATFVDPGNLRTQRATYRQLTGHQLP